MIINPYTEERHCHCSEFSPHDARDSIHKLILVAKNHGIIRLRTADHSDAAQEILNQHILLSREEAMQLEREYQFMKLICGVEADILNENGDVCKTIGGIEPKHIVLSAHDNVYRGNPKRIMRAYEKAIERHKPDLIGHPCANYFQDIDIERLIRIANANNVAMEFNCKYIAKRLVNLEAQLKMLRGADRIYVTSDAHHARDITNYRKIGLLFLKDYGFIR